MRLQRSGVIGSAVYIVAILAWLSINLPPLGLIAWLMLVVAAAAVVIPVSTLLVFANLAWANRAALRGVEAASGG